MAIWHRSPDSRLQPRFKNILVDGENKVINPLSSAVLSESVGMGGGGIRWWGGDIMDLSFEVNKRF